MKSRRLFLALSGGALALLVLAAGSRPPRAPAKPRQAPEEFPAFEPFRFPAPLGERLRYDVRLRGLAAGYVTMTVAETSDSAVTVEMEMRTTNALMELLYPIRDQAASSIAADGAYSLQYVALVRQGSRHVDDEQRHFYDEGVARWSRNRLASGKVSTGEAPLPGPVQDPISWLYYVRAALASGERGTAFAMLQRDSLWVVELELELGPGGEPLVETLDLGEMGEVDAVRVAAGADLGGIFGTTDPDEGGIWFDPATGVLLRVETATDFGRMQMTLNSIEND